MFRTQFLKLDTLKSHITRLEALGQGWPTCILNVKTQQEYRPEVKGPLSLFINLKGRSHCKVGNHTATIETDQFFLSNSGYHYDLTIDESTPTETFNIHIEQRLMQEVYAGMTLSEVQLLDQPDRTPYRSLNFFSQLYRRDPFIDEMVDEIRKYQDELNGSVKLMETEFMSRLLVHLVKVYDDSQLEMSRLPVVRSSTREETYRRLIIAKDLIHSCYREELSLDQLSQAACMSRFHFLRAFKDTFACTPYQYLKQLRLEKAQHLLRLGDASITEIGLGLGYQNLSSFSRVFRQSLGMGPQQFREQHHPNKFAILVNG